MNAGGETGVKRLLRLEEAAGPERAHVVRLILEQHAVELPGRFAVFQNDRLRIGG